MATRSFTNSDLKDGLKTSDFNGVPTLTIDYVVVAGGGGAGGAGQANSGTGGGGAGGVLQATGVSVLAGSSYVVTVGSGGVGGGAFDRSTSPILDATKGANSSIGSLAIATGGGASPNSNGEYSGSDVNGGSGSGGTGNLASYDGFVGVGTVFQGNNGAYAAYGVQTASAGVTGSYSGGGGGGAGESGATAGNNVSLIAGAGGDGITVNIEGSSATYGGGGAGGTYNQTTFANGGSGGGGAGGGNGTTAGGNGTANTGGGGGGTAGGTGGGVANRAGGSGGSGLVIIRYPIQYKTATTTGSPTITTNSSYRIYKFTGDGSITF
jgi:hypothetical protein